MVNFVFALGTQGVLTPDGGRHSVEQGSVYRAEDPVVQAAPYLFTDDPSRVAVSSVPESWYGDDPVEQATAGPGERRSQVKRG